MMQTHESTQCTLIIADDTAVQITAHAYKTVKASAMNVLNEHLWLGLV